jgi:hypothetical protein
MSELSIRRTVLELLVDDSFALSEIVARIQQERPQLSAPEARRIARETVIEMLRLGLVEALHLERPRDAEITLDRHAALIALTDELAWLASTHWRPHVRVTATSAGKDEYYEGGKT